MHIWEDNIKVDFNETGCENVDWIRLGYDMASLGSGAHRNETSN